MRATLALNGFNIVWDECSNNSFYELFAVNFRISFWIFAIYLTQAKVCLSQIFYSTKNLLVTLFVILYIYKITNKVTSRFLVE